MMKPKRIVVIGSLNLDLVARVERLPKAGETMHGMSLESFPGGKGANQAVAAAHLGGNVLMIGRVGDDAAGSQLRASLRQAGVDDRAVQTSAGSSGTALIHTDTKGENAITVIAGANALLAREDVEQFAAEISQAAIILAQLETPMETVQRASEIASRSGVPFVLDPAPATRLPSALLRQAAYLTPNETEAALLASLPTGNTGTREAEGVTAEASAAAQLRQMGAQTLILKRGSWGASVFPVQGAAFESHAFQVHAVDTTAAGDCFNGAFAVALSQGDSLQAAVRFANAAAALSVTRRGAQPSMPTLAEVEEFLSKHPDAAIPQAAS